MLLKKLKLNNFRAYKELSVDFSNSNLVTVTGSNGSGKSNLIESIGYILFGKSRFKTEDENIFDGDDSLKASLSFNHKDSEFEISRAKQRGKACIINIKIDGVDQTSLNKKVREMNAYIVELLGFDYDIFVATSFFRQKNADEFLSGTSSERKKYLNRILDLDRFVEIGSLAAEKQSAVTTQLSTLHGKISAFRQVIESEKPIATLQQTLDTIESSKSSVEQSLSQSINLFKVTKTVYEELLETKSKYKELLAKVRSNNEKADILQDQIRDAKSRLETMNSEKVQILLRNEETNKVIDDLKQQHESISCRSHLDIQNEISRIKINQKHYVDISNSVQEIAKCPTCYQEVSDEYKFSVRSVSVKKIEDLEKRSIELNPELQMALKKRDIEAEIDKIQACLTREGEVKRIDIHLLAFQETIDECGKSFERFINESKGILDQVAALEYDENKVVTASREVSEASDKVEDLKSQLLEFDASARLLSDKIENLEKIKASVDEVSSNIVAYDKQLQSYKELANIFRTKIPALIIHDTLSTIMTYANELLDRFNIGASVVIDTQALKADGSLKESLDIKVIRDTFNRSYESYSGGEQEIINFCLRYALSMMLKNLKSTSIRSVYLDESFASLDAENRNLMMSILSEIKSDFDQIFMITHESELRDSFMSYVQIKKEDGVSVVEAQSV